MGDIVNNKLFIPVLILACAAIISIVVLVVFSKKKKNKKINSTSMLSLDIPKTEIEKRIETEATVPITPVNESASILPTVPTVEEINTSVVPNVPVVEEKKEPILPTVPTVEESTTVETPSVPVEDNTIKVVQAKKEIVTGPAPTIDIPVPEMDDSPITVEEAKSLVSEDWKDSVEVERFNTIDETDVSQDEIINVNEAKQLVEDNQEQITVEETKSLTNDIGESVSVEEAKPLVNDMGETAFKSIPNGDMNINTDIKVEPVKEVSNKTEIFSLDDIKEALKQEEDKRDLL